MTILALLFSGLICLIGVTVLVSPGPIRKLALRFKTQKALYVGAAMRLIFGISLVFAAPASRDPGFIHTFGVILIVAAVLILIVGRARLEKLIAWWSKQGDAIVRLWGVVALLFGVILIRALLP